VDDIGNEGGIYRGNHLNEGAWGSEKKGGGEDRGGIY